MHCEKAHAAMALMDVGMATDERADWRKQLSPSDLTDVGMSRLRKAEVAWKELAPMDVTEEGSDTNHSDEQLRKADSPIALIERGMVTANSDWQP